MRTIEIILLNRANYDIEVTMAAEGISFTGDPIMLDCDALLTLGVQFTGQ